MQFYVAIFWLFYNLGWNFENIFKTEHIKIEVPNYNINF